MDAPQLLRLPVGPRAQPPSRSPSPAADVPAMSFAEVHALLAECHDAEIAALKRQVSTGTPSQTQVSVMQLTLSKDRERGSTQMAWNPREEDAKLARANGHKLQQLLQPATSGPESAFLDISCIFAETSEGDINFEPRRCWTTDGSLTPSVVRRRSISSWAPLARGDNPQGRWQTLAPMGRFRLVWDVCSILCLTLDVILLPLHAFSQWRAGATLAVFELLLHLFWCADIVVTLRTGFFSGGTLVMNQRSIAKNYARGWMSFDLLYAVLGLAWVVLQLSNESNDVQAGAQSFMTGLGCMQLFLRLVRLMRLTKMAESSKTRLTSDILIASASILQLSAQIVLNHHAIACIWYYIGTVAGSTGWVAINNLDSQPMLYRYATSLNYLFCQLGFGGTGIEPGTTLERFFGLFTAVQALAIFSTLVASLTSHAAFLNKSGEERRNEFRLLRQFLAHSQVEEELALRIQRFLEHAHALTKEVVDEIQVPLLRLLSKPLWRELRYAMYKHCLGEIGFVRSLSRCSVSDDLSTDATRQLSQALSQLSLPPWLSALAFAVPSRSSGTCCFICCWPDLSWISPSIVGHLCHTGAPDCP
ncbi:KCNH6 [Symbiodinium natans]|uniref:KCNH6 protein n=1 Tax=Symbiodinium natans TaxID=878477 RepID=A0A812PHQ1_9DINO|nr:KCNH6 [Symbiodinium natans]